MLELKVVEVGPIRPKPSFDPLFRLKRRVGAQSIISPITLGN